MKGLSNTTFTDLLSAIVDNRGRSCPTVQSGFPLIATNCIKHDSIYPTFENVRYIDEQTRSTWFRGHPQPNDIIFVCKGSPGRVAIVPDPVSFCIAQDMVALRADETRVHYLYLYYRLRSLDVQRKIEGMHVGTLIPHFKKGDFNKLQFLIHDSLDEQTEIANILGALDLKIESNKKIIRINLELAKNLYLNAISKGGNKTTLGDVALFHNRARKPLSASQRQDMAGTIPYYGAAGVFGSVRDALFDDVLALVGEDGSVLKDDGTPVTQYIWGPAWVNNHAHVLTGATVSTEMLYIAIDLADVRPLVTGAVQPKLSMTNLRKLALVTPPETALKSLEITLERLFSSHRARTSETIALRQLRDTLLTQLMAGTLRLSEAQKAVGDIA